MDTSHLLLDELHIQCNAEVIQFFEHGNKHCPGCYELFKRALEQDTPEAFTTIFRIFEFQVQKWVVRHRSFQFVHQPVDHFVSVAFCNFYFALRGRPLDQFSSVAQLLAYLKTCVHTAILQQVRTDGRRQTELELHEVEDGLFSGAGIPEEGYIDLWDRICALIPNEVDQLLMRRTFIEEMKPAEIAHTDSQHWANPREVAVNLYRIRRILRNDPALRRWAGLPEE